MSDGAGGAGAQQTVVVQLVPSAFYQWRVTALSPDGHDSTPGPISQFQCRLIS